MWSLARQLPIWVSDKRHKLGWTSAPCAPTQFTASTRQRAPSRHSLCPIAQTKPASAQPMDVMESCQACMDRPRAVRLACGHATFCELCTILAVKPTGLNCSVCRCVVTTLVVVPVTSTAELPLKKMPTFQEKEKEEKGRAFASVREFLQAKIADPSLLVLTGVLCGRMAKDTVLLCDQNGETSPGSRRRQSDDAEVAEEARKALLRISEEKQLQATFTIDAQGHVTVPEGVTELADYVFDGKTSLLSIALPASLTRIGSRAFRGCKSLVLTSLPDGVVNIGYRR